MPTLSRSVRIAGRSVLVFSALHIIFWSFLAYLVAATGLDGGQFAPLFIFVCLISAAGILGIVTGVGILRGIKGARTAALVLAAVAGFWAGLAGLVLGILLFEPFGSNGLFAAFLQGDRTYYFVLEAVYVIVFFSAIWWIVLFSRKSVAAQFSATTRVEPVAVPKKSACPPPVALLAWLMIASSALSAISWPLILGKIPAMLFTHVFSSTPSKWIWIANIALFLACGTGLLKLQRWSYTGTIALHLFWLVSLLATQLSPNYETYMRLCLAALQLADTYPVLNRLHFPQWVSATTTAIPTALLISGLFYYRRGFLHAVEDSHQPPS